MCKSPQTIWIKRGPEVAPAPSQVVRKVKVGGKTLYQKVRDAPDNLNHREWTQQQVPCKKCDDCKKQRVHDFAGRCMAEAAYSESVSTLTLTYAPRDDLADKRCDPRHFQLFMKLLRRRGHKVRYLVTAESGALKGRVHFHALLFWKKSPMLQEGETVAAYRAPGPLSIDIPSGEMVHLNEWPHGHVVVDWQFSEKSVRYTTKYLLKDHGCQWVSMSKKPPLGWDFFQAKAAETSALGILPSSFTYRPPGATTQRRYVISGATRRDYLRAVTSDASQNSPVGLFGLNAALKDRMGEWMVKALEKDERFAARQRADAIPLLEQMESMADAFSLACARNEERTKRLLLHLDFLDLKAADAAYQEDFRAWALLKGLPNEQENEQTWRDFCASLYHSDPFGGR